MKYVQNNTDNIIRFKCISEGKEKSIRFEKKSITALEDEIDTLFKTKDSYVKQFTDGILSYSTKATEINNDGFSYLKSYTMDFTTKKLTLTFSEKIAGEKVTVVVSSSSGTQYVDLDLEEGLTQAIVHELDDYLEFRCYNGFSESGDFPIPFSPRYKVYR